MRSVVSLLSHLLAAATLAGRIILNERWRARRTATSMARGGFPLRRGQVKQYGVRDLVKLQPKSSVTLMTPEPTGGYYRDVGVEAFLHRYGYPDKSGKPGRVNFGGIYALGRDFHADTGLKLTMYGFDPVSSKITDMDGWLALTDRQDEPAAIWHFRNILTHWNRKHAKAAYLPSLIRTPPSEYRYGGTAQLCEEADVLLLLAAIARGSAYYDPGIKMEGGNGGKPAIKRRSQFRVKHSGLAMLYQRSEVVGLG